MTENQREMFLNKTGSYLRFTTLMADKTNKPDNKANKAVYDLSLFTKGLLLNTSIDFNQLITKQGSSEAKAKFEELKLLRLQIQRLNEKPIAERYLNVDSLETIAQQKETELVKSQKNTAIIRVT